MNQMDMMKKVIIGCLFLMIYGAAHSQNVAIKTNIPYWATATPNLGMEFALGRKMTLEATAGFKPFSLQEDKYQKHWLAYGELRYWTCEKFNGHFFGLHGFGGQYNIGGWDIPFWHLKKLKDVRYQGYVYGAGISYGHQWILSNRWNLEMTIGGGYARLKHEKFPCVKCGTSMGEEETDFLGPTKGAISLIYIIK